MKLLLAILLGGFFGYALYKVQATNPKKLLAMLRLEDLHLAKVILFAIGFASVLLSIAHAIGIFDITHLSVKTLNLGVIIGGLIGALAFTLSYGYLDNLGLISGFDLGKLTLFNISPEYPSLFNIGYMGLFITGLLFMLVAYMLPKSILKK